MPAQAAQPRKNVPPDGAPATKKGDHVFLIDGSGYIFRAFHALPPLTRKSDGLQVNAVLGFCNMLWKLLREMKPDERPTHLAVDLRQVGEDVPQRNLSRLQGASARSAGRPASRSSR